MQKKSIRLPFFYISVFSILLMGTILVTQRQTASVVNKLKTGNYQAINTIRADNIVEDVINDIFSLDEKAKNLVQVGDTNSQKILQTTISNLETGIKNIKRLGQDNLSDSTLINNFLFQISRFITPVKKLAGENNTEARNLFYSDFQKLTNSAVTDSIYTTAINVQVEFEKSLEADIRKNESLSQEVLSLARVIGLISIGTILILGTIIIIRMLSHFHLIKRLHSVNEELELAKNEAEQAALVKEQFLSNMSHEIRTPVNSILGFTRLLQKTKLQGEQEEFTGLISTAGENLLNIINDILDISKIEAGMLRIDKNPFHLQELCYTIEMMFYHQALEKKITFDVISDDNLPEVIIGDKERLTQILINLINNAIKFTEKGSVTTTISAINQTAENATIRISVKDSGIGVRPENLKLIFERFEQEEVASNRKFGGTGLGLSIVKKLVTLQNGTINVFSEQGKGTEFIVEIPFAIKQLTDLDKINNSIGSKKTQEPNRGLNGNYKIMVAEDNKMNQMLLKYIFKQWDLSYDIVENGQMACAMIMSGNYDLALMDIQMPVMDGYEATRKIRNELKSNLPIIAMTANILPGEKEKCMNEGMTDYISKPLNENILYEMLLKYLLVSDSGISAKQNHFIDREYLNKTYNNNTQFTKEVISQFQKQYPAELEVLKSHVNAKDFSAVGKQSHHMKTTVLVVNKNSPLFPILEEMEYSEDTPSGWEIINFNLNSLLNLKDAVMMETNNIVGDLR